MKTSSWPSGGVKDEGLFCKNLAVAVVDICILSSLLQCAFSNGGHLFAAVQGNNIQLYSSTSFTLINTLKAHNGKIRCLLWSADDNKLISCGMDGAVYEWDPYTGKSLILN